MEAEDRQACPLVVARRILGENLSDEGSMVEPGVDRVVEIFGVDAKQALLLTGRDPPEAEHLLLVETGLFARLPEVADRAPATVVDRADDLVAVAPRLVVVVGTGVEQLEADNLVDAELDTGRVGDVDLVP